MSRYSHPPNILLICSDQHRASALGVDGNPLCSTPILDQLAAQGTHFTRCFAQNPVCMPQRASLLTGCMSRNHHVRQNGIPLSRSLPTLADVLKQHGYRTAAIGKLHLSPQADGVHQAPYYGFEELESLEDSKVGPYLDWALARYPEYEGYLIGTLFNLPTNERYWSNKRDFRREYLASREAHVVPLEISATCNWGFGHYSPLPPEAHQNYWIADRASDCLKRHNEEQPLFLWVGFVDPHNPFDPPKAFRDMYPPELVDARITRPGEEEGWPAHQRALRRYFSRFTEEDWRVLRSLYYASVTFMDEQIGRILQMVEQQLDMENTIIVYTSDHGEILGDHGICGKSAYHYDSCIRVPMIMRWDGQWRSGAIEREIIESTDLMPTLLEAAGVDSRPHMDGISYAPLLQGNPLPSPRRYAYAESFHGGPEDPTPAPGTWARTIRSDKWRATFYPNSIEGELYDMENDRNEVFNLWHDSRYRSVIEEHRRLLLDRLIMMDYPVRGVTGAV